MQLRGVVPKTHVDGFMAELIKHPTLFEVNTTVSLISYCYEICITCTGDNPLYSDASKAVFVVTQFSDHEYDGVVAGDEYLPIIILSHQEQLGGIQVVEAKKHGQQCALLIFSIFNTDTEERRTLSWIVRKSKARILN